MGNVVQAWDFALVRPHRWQKAALETIVREVLHQNVKGVVAAATGSGKTVVQTELAALLIATLAPHERIVVTAPSQPLVEQLYAEFSARLPGRVGMFYEHEKRIDRPVILACHASLVQTSTCCACVLSPPPPFFRFPVDARWRRFFDPCPSHPTETFAVVSGGLALALATANLRVKLWIADEAHKTSSMRVMAFAATVEPLRRVGFSATPFRSAHDERLWLFEKEIVRYSPTDALRDHVIVPPEIRAYEGDDQSLEDAIFSMIKDAEGPGVINAWDTQDAEAFAAWLVSKGFPAAAIHSYLSQAEQAKRLADLKAGHLRALVHVDLLVEGRNLPWLRWICLRRVSQGQGLPRVATTRLIQEVGRVLRTSKGKDRAIVYDPHGLFFVLSLTQDALLGGDWSVTKDAVTKEEDKESEDGQGGEEQRQDAPKKEKSRSLAPSDPLAAWAIRLRASGKVAWTPRTPKRLTERCDLRSRHAVAKIAKERRPALLSLPQDERHLLLDSLRAVLQGRATQAQGDDVFSILESLPDENNPA